jgi:hypothetical protein
MKKAAAKAKTRDRGWRFAIWLVLVAFTLQAYVTQVHIHDAAPTTIDKGAISKSITDAGHGKSPGGDNPLDCPFCQAVAQAGAFALPASPLLLLSVASIVLAAPDHPAAVATNTVAHIWRSRAPPQQ